MRKHFLLFFLMSLLPLGAWADGNIGVQLSTTMTKEFGTADPVYLAATDFVIISNTTGEATYDEETALAGVLKFKRKQDNEGESRGTYDYEVTVDATWAAAHGGITVVATNTGRITITEKALEDEMIGDIANAPFTFNATAWTPTPVVSYLKDPLAEATPANTVTLVAGADKDFTYSYEANVNAGTGKVIITAVEGGNYSGTAEKTFTINKKAIAADKLSIVLDQDVFTYSGEQIKPGLTIKDMSLGASGTQLEATDYKVVYTGNKDATLAVGETKLTVSVPDLGGNYTFGAVDKNFTINKHALTIAIKEGQRKVFGDANPAKYLVEYGTGENGFVGEETPATLATLEEFVEPTLVRVPGENAGVYAISITNEEEVIAGARNYNVQIAEGTVNFSIQAKDITDAITITLSNKEGDTYTYNGAEHFKNVAVTLDATPLTENVHYTVATTDNIDAGTATVTVSGMNNYKGSKLATFEIAKAAISVIPAVASKAYGVAQDPALDYTLKVGDNNVDKNVLHGTVELQREEGETVGTYNIWFKKYTATEAQRADDNYEIANTDNMETEVAATRYALFTITGSAQTLYLKFKEGTTATKEYGEDDPDWSIEDLEVDATKEGGAACPEWEDIKYTFGDPEFELASQDVADNATNKVSVTNVLTSPIYPTVIVGTMPFTITAKDVALVVDDQEIAYGTALNQNAFSLAEGYQLAGEEQLAVLNVKIKVDNLGTYAPGSEKEGVIYATINNPNYNLVTGDCKWGDLTVTNAVEDAPLYLADDNEDLLDQINAYNTLPVHAYVKISLRDRNLGGKDRTWADNSWNTMTLPFDITVAELSKILGYAVVNVVDAKGYSESESGAPVYKFNLTMKGGYGKDVLPANKPFVIKTTDALAAIIDAADAAAREENQEIEEDQLGYLDFGLRTIVAPTAADFDGVDAGGNSTFKPAYEVTPVSSADEGKIWFQLGNYAKWAYIKSSSTATWNIVPFEGFIDQNNTTAENPEAAIFLMEDIDGTVTAIKGVEVDNVNGVKNAEGLYNLNGMKLNSVPTQKGVYIQNGKKVVIK